VRRTAAEVSSQDVSMPRTNMTVSFAGYHIRKSRPRAIALSLCFGG
jgi:hypothetical protein